MARSYPFQGYNTSSILVSDVKGRVSGIGIAAVCKIVVSAFLVRVQSRPLGNVAYRLKHVEQVCK